jgi:hypothetical protein
MPWIIEGVFRQGDEEPLLGLPQVQPQRRASRFVHFLNPYPGKGADGKDPTQELTFETMRRARSAAPDLPVHFGAVVSEGEEDCVPADFELAGVLTRTVHDVATFAHPSPLPILFDILDRGCDYARRVCAEQNGDAETTLMIFSNVDICPLPHFYQAVADLTAKGYDTITINRRSIAEVPPRLEDIPAMYSDIGIDHTGFDCFVFPLAHYPKFVRSDACVGRSFVARSLLYNMIGTARHMAMLRRAHLTFHLGGAGEWNDPKYDDTRRFNVDQAKHVLINLIGRDKATALRLTQFCTRHKEPFTFHHDPAASGAGSHQ